MTSKQSPRAGSTCGSTLNQHAKLQRYERSCKLSSGDGPDLQHFDADEGVKCLLELGGDLAVIHQMDPNAVLETKSLDPFFCKRFLFLGQCEGVDFATECPGSLNFYKLYQHCPQ